MADIFLSYNEKDRDIVRRIAETLRSVGWSVWWDRRIPAGGTWRALLERELQTMRCMLVVWSSNSITSEWVCEEATEGRERHLLMPIRIEPVKPPAGFREIQAADLVGWDGSATFIGMKTLIEDIQQMIGSPTVIAPAVGVKESNDVSHAAEEAHAAEPRFKSWRHKLRDRPLWTTACFVFAIVAFAGGTEWLSSPREGRLADGAVPQAAPPVAGKSAAYEIEPALPAAMNPSSAPPQTAATTSAGAPALDRSEHAPEYKPPSNAARCAFLLQQMSLGETLSADGAAFRKKECK